MMGSPFFSAGAQKSFGSSTIALRVWNWSLSARPTSICGPAAR
jgi:hypothetical protein